MRAWPHNRLQELIDAQGGVANRVAETARRSRKVRFANLLKPGFDFAIEEIIGGFLGIAGAQIGEFFGCGGLTAVFKAERAYAEQSAFEDLDALVAVIRVQSCSFLKGAGDGRRDLWMILMHVVETEAALGYRAGHQLKQSHGQGVDIRAFVGLRAAVLLGRRVSWRAEQLRILRTGASKEARNAEVDQ